MHFSEKLVTREEPDRILLEIVLLELNQAILSLDLVTNRTLNLLISLQLLLYAAFAATAVLTE